MSCLVSIYLTLFLTLFHTLDYFQESERFLSSFSVSEGGVFVPPESKTLINGKKSQPSACTSSDVRGRSVLPVHVCAARLRPLGPCWRPGLSVTTRPDTFDVFLLFSFSFHFQLFNDSSVN